MVRDLAWWSALLLDGFPSDSVVVIGSQFLNAREAELPHVGHLSLFDVSSSVDVEVVINNETAVVGSSFWQFAAESDLRPLYTQT